MNRKKKTWLWFTLFLLVSPPAIATETVSLPLDRSLYPDRVWKKMGYNDKRLNYYNRMVLLAQTERQSGHFEEALKYINEASKALPETSERSSLRGYVLGECSKWEEATEHFQRFFKTSSCTPARANDVIAFCSSHKRLDVALSLAPIIDLSFDDPEMTLLLSKLYFESCDLSAARSSAERAFYLCCMLGKAKKSFIQNLRIVESSAADKPCVPNSSKSTEFWPKLDQLQQRTTLPKPGEIEPFEALVDAPRFISGNANDGSNLPCAFDSSNKEGSIRRAALHMLNDSSAPLSIYPNILTCCLTYDDVRKHLSDAQKTTPINVRERLGEIQVPTHGPTGITPDSIEATYPKRKVEFFFTRDGIPSVFKVDVSWLSHEEPATR